MLYPVPAHVKENGKPSLKAIVLFHPIIAAVLLILLYLQGPTCSCSMAAMCKHPARKRPSEVTADTELRTDCYEAK